MQMYACLHAHIRSRYWSYIADITLHYMTLPDITCHCATLHIHYMRVCTFYCIYTQIHALNELYPAAPGSMLPMTSIC